MKRTDWMVWAGITAAITVAVVLFAFKTASRQPPLPHLRALSAFTLTNQFGKAVSLDDLRGHPWLANIIFTRCTGPCPRMTQQLAQMQPVLASKYPGLKLVSLTADPAFDTPPVMKAYAERFRAQPERWWFLTGPKPELYNLAINGLMLALQENKPEERTAPEDLFVHSTLLVLVDGKANVRAVYESTDPETQRKVLADLANLSQER